MINTFKLFILLILILMCAPSCNEKPEIDMSNPFFNDYNTPFNVPPFNKIKAKHYLPAFEKGINDSRKELEAIVADKEDPTFDNTIGALDKMGDLLKKVSEVFFGQASANTNDSLRKIEVEISPKLAAFEDEKSLNPKLFERIKAVYENQDKFNLDDEQKFMLGNMYREFIRKGALLNKKDQDTLKVLNQKLSLLTVKFSQNVLSETNNYRMFITREDLLKGLPDALVAAAADEAAAAGFEGKWAFTTQRPSIFPFLTYCENREKRHELFNAYIMRGNNGNEFDNNKILADIVRLRAQRAKLLGYKNHASLVLEPRMAKNPDNVINLLNSLWSKAIPVAEKERNEEQKIIDKNEEKFKMEPSDWWYYAEKLRKQKYNLNDNELRPFFKLENVQEGLFEVATRLFGITFEPLPDAPVPHPEALAYEVKDADGSHLGVLYMDFHPRAGKQQGAWCGEYENYHIADGQEVHPIVTTVFNFTRPTNNTPALLSLEEVSTMYHEFGHALDALFSKCKYNKTYIAWDFVELPSQLMEHWAVEPEVLNMYAKHYKTNEPIPASLVKKIINSRYFNQGFATVEYLAASMLDMAYHTLEAPVNVNVQEFEKNYFDKIGLIPEIVSRYRSTYFLHIAGGYDAGYYSYIWAAVLDNDAFEAFKEKGIFNTSVASAYRKDILEMNGKMDAMQMFVNFRGREPVIEPLLKNRGLE
jgi:peptidyl-dipeptidase Dcp